LPFPEDFLWGASESGFQFEMGDELKKYVDSNTDWFKWVHDEHNISRGIVSGDLPEDGVNYWLLYELDHIYAMKLGLNSYRIGIEWSRIFPTSTKKISVNVSRDGDNIISNIVIDRDTLERLDSIANKNAVEHYRKIILDLRNKKFKVIVCLNHFTLPLWIHDPIKTRERKGKNIDNGWINEDTIIEFTKYVAYISWKLGDIVDMWATFNEPMVVTEAGFLLPESGFPPGIKDFNLFLKASRNIAVAHAMAYNAIKTFDEITGYKDSKSSAEVGIIHNINPVMPLNKNKDIDLKVSELLDYSHNKMILDATVNGLLVKDFIKRKSVYKNYLHNKVDWIGVNYYTRMVVKGKRLIPFISFTPVFPEIVEGYGYNCKPNNFSKDNRPTSDFGWEIYPEGLIGAIEIASKYGKPMYITENGIADKDDKIRPKFIVLHLSQLEHILEKKYDINGYFHWALTDNYEWAQGFRMKFGLIEVNLKTKKRIPRKSYEILRKIIMDKSVSEDLVKKYKLP